MKTIPTLCKNLWLFHAWRLRSKMCRKQRRKWRQHKPEYLVLHLDKTRERR